MLRMLGSWFGQDLGRNATTTGVSNCCEGTRCYDVLKLNIKFGWILNGFELGRLKKEDS
jgi:hypothetical protein